MHWSLVHLAVVHPALLIGAQGVLVVALNVLVGAVGVLVGALGVLVVALGGCRWPSKFARGLSLPPLPLLTRPDRL